MVLLDATWGPLRAHLDPYWFMGSGCTVHHPRCFSFISSNHSEANSSGSACLNKLHLCQSFCGQLKRPVLFFNVGQVTGGNVIKRLGLFLGSSLHSEPLGHCGYAASSAATWRSWIRCTCLNYPSFLCQTTDLNCCPTSKSSC